MIPAAFNHYLKHLRFATKYEIYKFPQKNWKTQKKKKLNMRGKEMMLTY